MSENYTDPLPPHPGIIVFVDQDTGTETVELAGGVPRNIAYAEVDGMVLPVTRVVKRTRGDQVIIRSYDQYGAFLQSTVGEAGP